MSGPLLVHCVMCLVDLGVRIVKIYDRAHRFTIGFNTYLTIFAINTQCLICIIHPGGSQPHATAFWIARDQLVPGVINNFNGMRVTVDREGRG